MTQGISADVCLAAIIPASLAVPQYITFGGISCLNRLKGFWHIRTLAAATVADS